VCSVLDKLATQYECILPRCCADEDATSNQEHVFIFQQDSAPAHRACHTNEFLRHETQYIIGPEQRPANSPDLNVNYRFDAGTHLPVTDTRHWWSEAAV